MHAFFFSILLDRKIAHIIKRDEHHPGREDVVERVDQSESIDVFLRRAEQD